MIHTAGNGMQGHVQYGVNSGLWWRWQFTGTQILQSYSSSDGVTWTARDALTLASPHNGDGQYFAAAYKNLSSHDVVHMAFSDSVAGAGFAGGYGYRVTHVRAVLTAAPACTFAAEDQVVGYSGNGSSLMADAPSIVFDSTNHVWIASALLYGPILGNPAVARSTNADLGASWAGGWDSATDVTGGDPSWPKVSCLNLSDTGGGTLLLLFNDSTGTDSTHQIDIRGTRYNGSAWGSFFWPFQVLSPTGVQYPLTAPDLAYAWATVPVSSSDIHLVRRNGTKLEHIHGGGGFGAGDVIPPLNAVASAGLSMSSDGTNAWLFAQDSETLRLMSARHRGAYPDTIWDAWLPLTN